MQLDFSVKEQTLTLESVDKKVVASSKNYLFCRFNFCDNWQGITKTAVFVSASGEVFNVILENDVCSVPHEVIKHPLFTVSVFGGDRITANKVVIQVSKSGYIEGETPQPPTPDVYNQLINSIKPPYIGENGNWYVWDIEKGQFVDSGFPSGGTVDLSNYCTKKELETSIQTAILDSWTEVINP